MQKVFDTPTPTALYVELGSGALTVHTDDGSQTVVDVNGKEADEVLVEQRGGEIVVIAPQRRAGFFGTSSRDLDVHVSLPDNSRLRTKLGSADVRAMGNLSEAMVKSGSGDVELDEVTDDALVETGSGDISVDRCGASIRAKAGSGDISVDHVGGNAYLSTGSGDIEIGRAEGSVELKSGSGDMRVHEMHSDVSLTTASGDLVVDLVQRGQLAARNVSGDITIGVAAGVPVWTDIDTMTGSVSSSLRGAGQPEEGQDYIEIRAKTVSGDIYLEQR